MKTGRATMYLVFVMMFILILSFVTRNIINIPLIWIIEMAQFVMTGYYLLGGGYSMLTDDHVRMDLIYSKLKEKTKALLDSLTSVFLIFYLIVLFYGSISSLTYTILLMLLQSFAIFFKDLAKVLGREI